MNDDIVKEISKNIEANFNQVKETLTLLSEGNTIPFIARYRKEKTGGLDEEQIKKIEEVYRYELNLKERKDDVIRLIEEKGLLTEELRVDILACTKLVDVEDLYRPFKEKKKTKATEAIANGLEGLAKKIMLFTDDNIKEEAKKYLNDNVLTIEDAIIGAKYIIAEEISDTSTYRKEIRRVTYRDGLIFSKKKKTAASEDNKYEIYYDFSERVNRIKPHQTLAINRGEKEKILTVSVFIEDDNILNYLEKEVIKKYNESGTYVKEAISDGYSRLIKPSIEREIRNMLSEDAEEQAIYNFSKNVENLLLTPPIKEKVVMGFDPAFRTGCKIAIVDWTGKLLKVDVIYPTEPHNKIEESKKIILDYIEKYKVDVIAIGNGTASRESEKFISDCIKESKRKVEYIIVSEAGASVYSASKLASSEFPDLTVEKRSAVSIARRLQDPLAELVKIDPKSIGVGLYQHDVTPKKLDESLNFIVTKTVNQVGINLNTASSSLLSYVSGMNKKAIDNLLQERDTRGKFESREELKKIKGLTAKVYEQAIGFMRILGGKNPLDKTSIHPESYKKTEELLKELKISKEDIGKEETINLLNDIDLNEYSKKLDLDMYTLKDIIDSLNKPGRDPRDEMDRPILRNDILRVEDLNIGTKLQGTIRNVVDFGAFIDIGLHNDGLAHISRLTNRFIKHPSEVVSVGDIVDCYVVDIKGEKVSLSLVEKNNKS